MTVGKRLYRDVFHTNALSLEIQFRSILTLLSRNLVQLKSLAWLPRAILPEVTRVSQEAISEHYNRDTPGRVNPKEPCLYC